MSTLAQFAVLLTLAFPGLAMAAGGGSSNPPKPTETSTKCKASEVWDTKTQKCIDAQQGALDGRFDNDTLFQAARELAYAGRPDDALVVLSAMTEGDSDRVLTYKGFASRKAGRIDEGMKYYQAALARNPDNLLARSYMGQGLVQQGQFELAAAQLDQILVRGGKGTWAAESLQQALATGQTFSY